MNLIPKPLIPSDLQHNRSIEIADQSNPCQDHPNDELIAKFQVTRTWRGWVVRCSTCNKITDEWDGE